MIAFKIKSALVAANITEHVNVSNGLITLLVGAHPNPGSSVLAHEYIQIQNDMIDGIRCGSLTTQTLK